MGDETLAQLPGVALVCVAAFVAAWSPALAVRTGWAAALLAIVLSARVPRLRMPDVLAGTLAIWALTLLLTAEEPQLSFPTSYLYASSCLAFVAARHVVRTRRAFFAVGYAYLAGCVSAAADLIMHAASGMGPVRESMFDFSVRYGLEGINANYTSYTLVTGLVVAAALLLLAPSTRTERLGTVAAAVVLAYGVLLTGTKGSAVGVIIGAACLALGAVAPKLTRKTAALLTPAALILIPLGFYEVIGAQLIWLDGVFGRATGDLSGRTQIWPYALSAWSDSLLTGTGPGMLAVTGPLGLGAHNLLLTVGNDLGLIGVVLYGATFAAALAGPLRHVAPACPRVAATFLVALLPIWLTGHWENSPVSFMALALVSVAPVAVRSVPKPAAVAPALLAHRLPFDGSRVSGRAPL